MGRIQQGGGPFHGQDAVAKVHNPPGQFHSPLRHGGKGVGQQQICFHSFQQEVNDDMVGSGLVCVTLGFPENDGEQIPVFQGGKPKGCAGVCRVGGGNFCADRENLFRVSVKGNLKEKV